MNPSFPVVWLGEKCGVVYFESYEELCTIELSVALTGFFDNIHLIDVEGNEWSGNLNEKLKVPILDKLLNVLGNQRKIKVSLNFQKTGTINLTQMKEKLILQSERDSGDSMWQFIGHNDIVKGVSEAANFASLFKFVHQGICSEA